MEPGSLNMFFLKFTESISVCAVNLFVLISAFYLSKTNKRKISKVLYLFIQIIIFKFLFYIINCVIGNDSISAIKIFNSLIPSSYFITLYSIIYVISPYFNILIEKLNKIQLRRMVVIFFLIFSVWSIGVDLLNGIIKHFLDNVSYNGLSPIGEYGSQNGYTIVNFGLIYFIGAYIQKNQISFTKSKSLKIFVISVLLILLMSLVSGYAFSYNNPLVIISAVSIFLLFKEIEFSNLKINELSKAVFTSILFHPFFMDKIYVELIVKKNIVFLMIHQLSCCLGLFIFSYFIYKIYHFCFKRVFNKFDKINNFDLYKMTY